MSVDAFIASLIDPLSQRSLSLIEKIWLQQLDAESSGNTTAALIQQHYDGTIYNEGCPYIGRYTDPNHAGSFRVVTLLDEMNGDKRLALCEGIGGEGEPASFMLPSWINPDDSIVIDFSAPPKGGPKDFHGTWDNDGIKFTRDGNKWP